MVSCSHPPPVQPPPVHPATRARIMPKRTRPVNEPDSPHSVLPSTGRKPPFNELPAWLETVVRHLLAQGPILEQHNAREFDWDRFVCALLLPKHWRSWSRALRTCAAVRAYSANLHLADERGIVQAIVRLVVGSALRHIRNGDNAVKVQRHINTVVDRQMNECKFTIVHVVKLVFLFYDVRCLARTLGKYESCAILPALEAIHHVQQQAVTCHSLDHRQRDISTMFTEVLKCKDKMRAMRACVLVNPWYALPQTVVDLKQSHSLSLVYAARIFVSGLPPLPQLTLADSAHFASWLISLMPERWRLLGMAVSAKRIDPVLVANVILKAIGEAQVVNIPSGQHTCVLLSPHVVDVHTKNGFHFHTFLDYLEHYAAEVANTYIVHSIIDECHHTYYL